MPKKCPPGVLCIENVTIVFILVIVVLAYLVYLNVVGKNNKPREKEIVIINKENKSESIFDILRNPYAPPLKNTRYMGDPRGEIPTRGVPINIKTRGFNDSYRQVGILTRQNGPETILGLMGRPLHTNRSKWQYYTISDQNNSVKLPISKGGRSCTGEYGCDDLYNGDSVYVEGYNDAFKVTIYENNTPTYIPYL